MPPDPHTHTLSLPKRKTETETKTYRENYVFLPCTYPLLILKKNEDKVKKKTGALDKNVDFSIYYFSLNTLLLGYAH